MASSRLRRPPLHRNDDIPWTGSLSLLVKKRSILPLQIKKKPSFLSLFWHLISQEDGAIWMRGYVNPTVGSEFVQEFRIKAYTHAFGLPEWALPYCSGGQYPICVQTPDSILFLTSDTREKRKEFFQCLSSLLPLSPNPVESSGRHDEYGRYGGFLQGRLRQSRSETNLRQNNPYYSNIDEGDYEAFPLEEPPPVPQRQPQNGPTFHRNEPEQDVRGAGGEDNESSTSELVQIFRSQKFQRQLLVTLHKPNVDREAVKLCVGPDNMIIVARLTRNMFKKLHVGDVIIKMNRHSVTFINHFYDLIESSDTDKIELEILRVPHGCLCHVTLPARGRIDSLGVSFSDHEKPGVEVTAIEEDGLVFKSNQLQNSRPEGVTYRTRRVNWGLVEINQHPVPLHSSKAQVEKLLSDAGIELALVLLPMDLVHLLRDSCPEK